MNFSIPDMTCGHCASAIARAVASVDKEARLEVDIPQKRVSVLSTAPESELAEAIQEAGYTPEKFTAPALRSAPAAGGCCCGTRQPRSPDAGVAGPARRSSCCS
ncbi:heavy-metal-associated domain-containing protein [Caenimonas sedimenti]|uniref:Heavy-metal-associated domain-containing protein n=1 Tax=Caenimonas sedimenti TaxID=2596921 RepID=A0A562ZIH1_9BURK|nr:heavy-metal-associated domain-containing protein [Caenimonas sedimenti]